MDKIMGLSEQQKACLRLVHQGLRTKEIAPIVQLAPASIDTYIRLAMVQLGTRDRRDAARILAQFEMLEPPSSELRKAPSGLPQVSERFVSELESLPKTDVDRKNGPRRIGLAIVALLRPPPLGGVPNDLSFVDRIREMLRTACLMMVVVASLTLLFIGALRALR